MQPLKKITRQILAQNNGRDLDRLLLKLASLRQDPFAFCRGTNALFLGFLPRAHALFQPPRTCIHRVHLITCKRGLPRAIPKTPLRTTSTISPNALKLAISSPISVSVLVNSTM